MARRKSAAPGQSEPAAILQGQGDPGARIVFTTQGTDGGLEGPAGQLFDKMIEAIGLKRAQVYVVQAAPGELHPTAHAEIVVSLGQSRGPLKKLRVADREIKFMSTWHPAYLLQNPESKKEAWADLQAVARELGLQIPKKETR